MSENVEISYPSEGCYEQIGGESTAVVNPAVSSNPVASGGSSEKIETFVADISDKCAGESLNVTEQEVHTTPRITKGGAKSEVPPKTRQTNTVLWEPLLVPTEVDGKCEMVTALKRVGSDYISSPRTNPRVVGAQIVKEAKLMTPRMDKQGAVYGNTTSKVAGPKSSTEGALYGNSSSKIAGSKSANDADFKHGVKKEIIKKKAPDINISEQMGKAIAEKEAAILKEIEKAMKEANIRNRSMLSDRSAKIKITPKIVPAQNIQENESHDVVPQSDPSETPETEKDDKKSTPSSSSKDVITVTRMQNTSNVSKSVPSSTVGLVSKEMHGVSKVPTIQGKIVATPAPVIKPVNKEAQPVNRILQVPRTVMITSTGGPVPQVKNKILCGPATVVSSPTSTAVITTRDTHAVNQLFTVPVNTSSNPQTLTEISQNSGPRILLLASPSGGGLPLLTPIMPATSIPFIHTPVSAPTMTISRGPVKMMESPRILSTRARKDKNLKERSFAVPETATQNFGPESDILRTGSSKTGSVRKSTVSHDSTSENKQVSLSSQNILSSEAKTQSKHKPQTPLHTTTKGNKNHTNQSEDKRALIVSQDKSVNSDVLEKQEGTGKPTTANITVNGKTAKNPPMRKNDLHLSVKNQQKVDCNGENMDIDEESVSEELDHGFVDYPKNISSQNSLSSGKTKDATLSGDNKQRGEQKRQKSSRKSIHNDSNDHDSQDALEKRLERIEQMYNEIPPFKPRISFSEEGYSKIRDGFRDNMHTIRSITASFKDLINQSSSLSCKGLIHSSCQTETVVDNGFTESVRNEVGDDKDVADGDLGLCRLCGGVFKTGSLISLFGKLSKEKDLLSMWSTILPQAIPLKEDDGLPQNVCEACVQKLTLCHSILNQFLQADKELRQVLHDEKPVTSNSMSSEETSVVHPQENEISSGEIVTTPVDNLHSQQCDSEIRSCTNEVSNEECLNNSETPVETHGQKRRHAHAESESVSAEKSTPNPKHKRRRSKSSDENDSLHTTKTPAPSGSSSGCIDLSRLDPEYNDGFEVEWCLDEETIRSSMIPEEDVSPVSEDSAVSTRVTAEGASEAGKIISTGPEGCADSQSGKVELHVAANPQKKKKGNLGNETPKHIDEVSKLVEVPTSVCRSPEKSGNKQIPVSAVLQEQCDVQHNVLTQSPNLLKCSSCPLSFHSKQELMLHQVMQHDKAGTSQRPEGKQDNSSAIESKNLPQKQINSSDSKLESECSEESMICDQCGLPFPNEYSLCLHKSVIHGTSANSQLIIKDSKGLEYKIISSKETLEENVTHQEISEASLSDGKILVKCGSGMLWVNCSKYFSEDQIAAVQSSDLTEVNYVNVESGTVTLADQNIPTASPQSVAKVQFAYMCDHCKQIFPSRAELLPHMQIHLNEKYSCSECGAKFASVKALNNHVSIHVPLDRVCDECGLILVDSKKLVQHRKEHTHNLPHVCETCGKRFPNEQTLEVHETVHYSKKGPLSCSLCRKYFFFKHSIVRHRSQHASNRLQKCSLCFRVLNSSDQLRKHVALHHLMKNFVCFCKQTFPSQKELVEHRYLKHSYAEIFCARNKVEIVEPLPLHQCSVCLMVLNSKQSLQKHHAASHSSTWPFFCIQCSRKYASKYHLAKHECHRKNTSSFQCKICGKAFQNKNIFKQHKSIHSNRKWRYICRLCGKTFQKSPSLVSHIMTHGGKKFLCPRCYQPCQDKEGLLKHYNTGSCQMKKKLSH